jgi:hypothetical protein
MDTIRCKRSPFFCKLIGWQRIRKEEVRVKGKKLNRGVHNDTYMRTMMNIQVKSQQDRAQMQPVSWIFCAIKINDNYPIPERWAQLKTQAYRRNLISSTGPIPLTELKHILAKHICHILLILQLVLAATHLRE